MRTKDSTVVSVRLRFSEHARIGPGKIALLEAVHRTGSIAQAGREMGMSYRRAWLLIDSMNAMFDEPVILASSGDSHASGSGLTPLGHALVEAYRQAERDSQDAVARRFEAILERLRPEPGEPRSPPDEPPHS